MAMLKTLAVAGLAIAALAGRAPDAAAGDLILAAAKPGHLYVIDAARRTVRSDFAIADAGDSAATIVPSPDGRRAYVLVNRMESIVGIDLRSGKAVFRADLSSPGERVKDFFAFAVTPDGKELIAYELPTRLLPSEYHVEQPRFAVFRTDAGLKAEPVRSYPAPRRVVMMLMRPSGKSFYALGFDLDEFDVTSGRLVGTRGITRWQLPEHSQPDVLAFWPVTEPSGVFTTPVTSDVTHGGSTVARTGIMTLDVGSGALDFHDFEDTAAIIFSSVMSPDHKTVYGSYTTLTKVDLVTHTLAQRQPLDHTFYAVNIASDGKELYVGGAMCDVAFYDPANLAKRAMIQLPGCGDQSVASLRVIKDH